MKTTLRLTAIVLALALPSAAGALEPGIVSLWNGKDLTGWSYGTEKPKGKGYQIDKGVLFTTVEEIAGDIQDVLLATE